MMWHREVRKCAANLAKLRCLVSSLSTDDVGCGNEFLETCTCTVSLCGILQDRHVWKIGRVGQLVTWENVRKF